MATNIQRCPPLNSGWAWWLLSPVPFAKPPRLGIVAGVPAAACSLIGFRWAPRATPCLCPSHTSSAQTRAAAMPYKIPRSTAHQPYNLGGVVVLPPWPCQRLRQGKAPRPLLLVLQSSGVLGGGPPAACGRLPPSQYHQQGKTVKGVVFCLAALGKISTLILDSLPCWREKWARGCKAPPTKKLVKKITPSIPIKNYRNDKKEAYASFLSSTT